MTTKGLRKTTANGYGYTGETAWITADGKVAFIADGRPSGAAVLRRHDDGLIVIDGSTYCEAWEVETIAAARKHEGV